MSLHAAKGLSAKFVVITSCVEGLIPKAIDRNLTNKQKVEALEEQRRLFYVGITRCKNDPGKYPGTLIISSFVCLDGLDALKMGIKPAKVGMMKHVQASRFLRELELVSEYSVKGTHYLCELLSGKRKV